MASVELVAWDGGSTLMFSKEEGLVARFMEAFPLSEDLEAYSRRAWSRLKGTADDKNEYE